MIERALTGGRRYWTLIAVFLVLIGIGFVTYLKQLEEGLGITGMGRDVPWGFYIAQFTFLVGVAASAVMVVLPYYLHDFKTFSKLVILGEFLAIPSVLMCMLFILVDMGQPFRVLNIILHPTLNSLMFWDMLSLGGYLGLNIVITFVTFTAYKKHVAPPKWIRPIIILSVPWAVSIHTVTAFLYAGLEGRAFWMTAILAPRFLASAFAAGPSLLLILCLIVRKYTEYDPGKKAIQKLGEIITYAMLANVFFILLEVFTALYSDIPEHVDHFRFLFFGFDGNTTLVPWMWTSVTLAVISLGILLVPRLRHNERFLALGAVTVITSIWIDKGLGMVVTGFIPTTMHKAASYWPTLPEFTIGIGVYSVGFLILTVLYKVATSHAEDLASH